MYMKVKAMLEHITHKTCPDCGGSISSESRSHQHSNGHWNEIRVFKCGAKFEFSPNFMIVTQTSPCANTDDSKRQRFARLESKRKLDEFIANLDTDSEFKTRLRGCLSYVNFD